MLDVWVLVNLVGNRCLLLDEMIFFILLMLVVIMGILREVIFIIDIGSFFEEERLMNIDGLRLCWVVMIWVLLMCLSRVIVFVMW